MGKNLLILLLSLLLFSSCQYFEKQVPSKEELLEKELKSINWSEVDEFPSVPGCDTIKDKETARQCFFDFLTQTIQQKLNADTLAVLYPELTTIQVKVTVFPDSQIKFEPHLSDSLAYGTKEIDSIIQTRLVDFPKVSPATKRGIPVKTQFMLPVILNVE